MVRYTLTGASILLAAAGVALAAHSQAAPAQTPAAPIIHDTFDDSDGGWTVMNPIGSGGHIVVTHAPAHVKTGSGALELDYSIKKGEVAALLLPITGGKLAKAGTIQFQVRADSATTMACTLQEHEGGRYTALFSAPKDRWQQVELAPSDFYLSEDANDPKDPDGKLDLDQVEAIAITDVGQLIAQGDNQDFVNLFGLKQGPHTLYVDDFEVTAAPLPPSAGGPIKALDTFARPQISWIGVGEPTLSVAAGRPLEGRGLAAEYHVGPGKVVGLVRKVTRGTFTGAPGFAFDVASRKPARLLVQVEERGGGKYNTMVNLNGGEALQHITISFAMLDPADDSHDANGKLDPDEINQLVFIDASGLVDMVEQDNAVWLGNLRVAPAK